MKAPLSDRRLEGSSSSSLSRIILALALISTVIVLLGLIVMLRNELPMGLPMLPTGILSDVFDNAEEVLYGTLCTLLGCIGIYRFLPAYLGEDRPHVTLAGHPYASRMDGSGRM